MKADKLDGLLYGSITVLALFIAQVLAGKAGGFVASLVSYKQFDFDNAYAWVLVHHIVQMIVSLGIIGVLSKLLKIDFGFGHGDTKRRNEVFISIYCRFCSYCIDNPYSHVCLRSVTHI